MEMFEQATREKIRFETSVGLITVEDLWDLPLTSSRSANLDNVAKSLHKELKETSDEVSFVNPEKNVGNELLQLSLEIVKHVIKVKIEERKAVAEATKRREQKQQILGLIAQKQNEQLAGKSLEELTEMVNAL